MNVDALLSSSDGLKDQISKAAGNIDFAILTISPIVDGVINRQEPVTPKKSDTFSKLKNKSFSEGALSLIKDAGAATLDKAVSVLKESIGMDGDVKVGDLPPNTFILQYNPASISFSTSAELPNRIGRTIVDKDSSGKELPPRLATTQDFLDVNDVTITMSVELIFEDVDNEDAFLENKLSPINGEMVTSLLKTAGKVAGVNKKHHSVRDKVQALTYLCRNSAVRHVTFSWGKTSLGGKVTSVKADYTMFSPAGEPIYAKVHMDLQLLRGAGAVQEWDDIYLDSFGQGTGVIKARDLGVVGNIQVGDTNVGDILSKGKAFTNISL